MANPHAVNVHFELATILPTANINEGVHVIPEGPTIGEVLTLTDLSGTVHDERVVGHGDHTQVILRVIDGHVRAVATDLILIAGQVEYPNVIPCEHGVILLVFVTVDEVDVGVFPKIPTASQGLDEHHGWSLLETLSLGGPTVDLK